MFLLLQLPKKSSQKFAFLLLFYVHICQMEGSEKPTKLWGLLLLVLKAKWWRCSAWAISNGPKDFRLAAEFEKFSAWLPGFENLFFTIDVFAGCRSLYSLELWVSPWSQTLKIFIFKGERVRNMADFRMARWSKGVKKPNDRDKLRLFTSLKGSLLGEKSIQ